MSSTPFDYTPASSFSWRIDGLRESEAVEPDRAGQRVRTRHGYHPRGDQNATPLEPCAEASPQAGFQPRGAAGTYGAFAISIGGTTVAVPAGSFGAGSSHALGPTETRRYARRFGAVLSVTGTRPIGLSGPRVPVVAALSSRQSAAGSLTTFKGRKPR